LSQLVQLFNDKAWIVRSEICKTFSYLRIPEAIPYLRAAAADSDWVVRSNAVKALAKLDDKGEEALLQILDGEDRYARHLALVALEQSSFFEKNLRKLQSDDEYTRNKGKLFFSVLIEQGESKLALEAINSSYSKEEDIL